MRLALALLALAVAACASPDDAAPDATAEAAPADDVPAVCRALAPAVALGSDPDAGYDALAAPDVLEELTVDADFGYTIAPADVEVWTEGERCVLSAAFDEEFVLTLDGDRAVEIEVRPATRPAVAFASPDEAAGDDLDLPDDFEPGYVVGEAVCELLLPVVRENATSPQIRYRSTAAVRAELSEDARGGFVQPDAEFYASEGRADGTCEISGDSMGDAWYVVTLEGLDGDVGDRATAVRLATSYD